MTMMKIRTYTELMSIPTFLERYYYLKLGGRVGEETFGSDRYFNQAFYHSDEWRRMRNRIISRDFGCDLADRDHPFAPGEKIYIHHMNPIVLKDIVSHSDYLLDEEFLIATSFETHQAIHYGDDSFLLLDSPVIRRPNDTCPWRC